MAEGFEIAKDFLFYKDRPAAAIICGSSVFGTLEGFEISKYDGEPQFLVHTEMGRIWVKDIYMKDREKIRE